MNNPYKTILDKEYTNGNYRTKKGTCYLGKIDEEEFLHVLFYGIDDKECEDIKRKLILSNKNGSKLDEYLGFLKLYNGALLFGGSINLFGVEGDRDEMDSPSSLLRPLSSDKISKEIFKALYIGNCPHIKGGNMNFYFNLDSGLVVGYYKNEIQVTWLSIYDMIKDLIDKYDKFYLPTGLNKFYGLSEKGVYNNIQKFIF